MTLIPQIDELACSGHGDCAVVAPDVFRIDDIAVVIGAAPDELVLAGAQSCPSVAISVVDEQTGQQVYP